MKKYISIIAVAALITASGFIPTNQVFNSNCLAEDPPVIIPPPYNIPTRKLAFEIIKINTPPVNATNAV